MSYDLKLKKGDLVLNSDGQLGVVQRNEKLRQDVIKILLTDIGENKFHTFYGSKAGKLDIGTILSQDFFRTKVEESIIQAINNLMVLQRSQGRYQFVSPAEKILSINSVEAFRDENDPRMWSVFISIITLEQDELTQTITIRI
jgi:hypothetical protein